MSRYLYAYLATAVAFCVIDFVWLGLVAPSFYRAQIGPLLLDKPNLVPALIFYVLYVIGLVIFCVIPGVEAASWVKAGVLGALFGLFAYATYDLSNLATLKNWTWQISIVDMLWGSAASAIASTCGYIGTQFLTRVLP